MPSQIRRADPSDLHFLLDLEQTVFLPARRESRASLRRSLSSPHQEVWLALEEGGLPVASLVLRLHRKTLRIYSLAVLPQMQGKGLGGVLLRWAQSRAEVLALPRITLEADGSDGRLTRLYEAHGFKPSQVLGDYYGEGADGIRFEKWLTIPSD